MTTAAEQGDRPTPGGAVHTIYPLPPSQAARIVDRLFACQAVYLLAVLGLGALVTLALLIGVLTGNGATNRQWLGELAGENK